MSGGNEKLYNDSGRFTISEQNAAILWIVVTVAIALFATVMGASLAGTFTSFPFGVAIPFLIMVPIILYLFPQTKSESLYLGWKTTLLVPLWFFSVSLLIAPLGYFFSSIAVALLIFLLGFSVPLYYLRSVKGLSLSSIGLNLGTKRNILSILILTIVYGFFVFIPPGFKHFFL